MSRLRYICGGEEGWLSRGSLVTVVGGGCGAVGEEVWELALADCAICVGEMFGGGAPLTSWSSLESDIIKVRSY